MESADKSSKSSKSESSKSESSKSEPPSPITLTSTDRALCWKFRDLYLSCLASNFSQDQFHNEIKAGIIPEKLRSEECNGLRAEMYAKCPLSWVRLNDKCNNFQVCLSLTFYFYHYHYHKSEHFEKKFRGDKLREYQMKKLTEIGAQPL